MLGKGSMMKYSALRKLETRASSPTCRDSRKKEANVYYQGPARAQEEVEAPRVVAQESSAQTRGVVDQEARDSAVLNSTSRSRGAMPCPTRHLHMQETRKTQSTQTYHT